MSTHPAASVPDCIIVPAGKKVQTFAIATAAVTSIKTGAFTAISGGISKSAALKVRPIGVKSVALTPNPVTGGNNVTGTVTLECPAAPGDITVALSSTNTAVAKPTVSSMTIPAGQKTATFTVSTTAGASGSPVIKAKANNMTKSAKLTVNP